MTSPGCPEKETQISEVVGVPTLVTDRPRLVSLGHPETFTNRMVTLGSLPPLILALPATLGIDFPYSSFCI